MGVRLFFLQLQCGCKGRQEWSVLGQERRFRVQNAPESQTLIVLSYDPETIDDPSGEKATEQMLLLCAFVFSVLSSTEHRHSSMAFSLLVDYAIYYPQQRVDGTSDMPLLFELLLLSPICEVTRRPSLDRPPCSLTN